MYIMKMNSRNHIRYMFFRHEGYYYTPMFCCNSHSCCNSPRFTKIRPIFGNMFSDNRPRFQVCLKPSDRIPMFINKNWHSRQVPPELKADPKVDIVGVDRHRFFSKPTVPMLLPATLVTPAAEVATTCAPEPCRAPAASAVPASRSHGTQTDYRESEAQTTPWAPPCRVADGSSPEVLSLAMLSWGHGLPAGMHEVRIIERARVRRKWEEAVAAADNQKDISDILEAMEREEWSNREQEIQMLHDARLEVARRIGEETKQEARDRLEERLRRYRLTKEREKERKLHSIRHQHNRELRRLAMKHQGVQRKYVRSNVIDELADYSSELYAPQMRFGEHPRRRHEVIKVKKNILSQLTGEETVDSVARRRPAFDYERAAVPRKQGEMCARDARWLEQVLQKLHEDLLALRQKQTEPLPPLRLLVRLEKPLPRPETPGTEGVPDEEEQVYQAAVLLQKLIKGRAIQTLMHQGRIRCQALIDELKTTHSLTEAGMAEVAQRKLQVESLYEQRESSHMEERRRLGVVDAVQGREIGSTLDFLSSELCRLLDERRAHAFALMAERERHRREAAEAGRRQAEEARRREHDQMFAQVMKVQQDTVDLYLEDVILESVEWASEDSSRRYIRGLAAKMDQAAAEAHSRGNYIEQEEMVADLIHNYLLPEAEKRRVRQRIKDRQRRYLEEAHAAIQQSTPLGGRQGAMPDEPQSD
ncbi:cilia- and flagella-associated protein 91-like isoform X1 [Bacillus rossius redtenbacheri]|uniref:cilia- and flagella-associated protein 91-like isoform X1 n=1 Tax=Bacillus rossius redtenbacheri TaxID=93214 RepID=UPI002FDE824E